MLDKLSPPLAGLGNEEEAAGAAEEVDDDAAEKITRLHESGRTLAEVERLRVKALQRRAKARLSVGTWAALQAAEAGG